MFAVVENISERKAAEEATRDRLAQVLALR